jgi:hypothetical protein
MRFLHWQIVMLATDQEQRWADEGRLMARRRVPASDTGSALPYLLSEFAATSLLHAAFPPNLYRGNQ